MNRVTIINLAGRAWHVEDAGVALLEAWLEDARTRLASDPDRDELIADFERAISDRFADLAPGERDVVTAEQARTATDALGTVEPAGSSDASAEPADAPDDAPTEPIADPSGNAGGSWRERRLYRLTGPGESQLAGVCAGLAAYLNVDVTVVRVAVVLLALITGGVGAIAYIVLAFVMPEASSSEERAAARGYDETAQELMRRAREQASPALTTLGSTLATIGRVLVTTTRVVLLVAIWTLLAAWAGLTLWMVFDPSSILDAFDPGTSIWLVALWLTCLAWIPTGVLLACERALAAIGRPARARPHSRPLSIALATAWVVSLIVAAGGAIAIPANSSKQISSFANNHDHTEIRAFHRDFCFDLDGTSRNQEPPCADTADHFFTHDEDDDDRWEREEERRERERDRARDRYDD